MDIIEKVGKRLQMIRLYSDVKQKVLAEELGVNAPLLSMYEKGRREPSLTFIVKFCDRFGLTIGQFFSFEDVEAAKKTLPDNPSLDKLESILSSLEHLQVTTHQ